MVEPPVVEPPAPRLRIVPLELRAANALVAGLHRHHKPATGHRFSLGVVDAQGVLHGAAIVGRPVARMIDQRAVLEVTRLVTDGTPNACSALYAAAARVGRALGYQRIQTYILGSEPGVTLRAAGWVCEGPAGGGDWHRPTQKDRRASLHPLETKQRWSRVLNEAAPALQGQADGG